MEIKKESSSNNSTIKSEIKEVDLKKSSNPQKNNIQSSDEFNSCDTFIEYFYIFGARESSIRSEHFYHNLTFTKPGHLTMQLLSKFPPFEKPNSNMDENVILNHCFPTGYNLYIQNNPNDFPKNECFHFNLDNLNSLGLDDKKIYFTCLLFYEPLVKYYELFLKIKKNNAELNHTKANIKPLPKDKKDLLNKYYIPKIICFSSFVPFPSEEKYLLIKILEYVSGMTKGIQNNIIIPIEKIIEKLILGVPRPPKGKFYITYKNNNCIIPNSENDYDIKQRELNQYNYYSYKMHLIFYFKLEEIIEILKCLLMEIPILFFSKNKEKLTNIFETFIFLLSPFEYQYPHVSLLPDINSGIIEMAKSFAFGINYEWVEPGTQGEKKNYFEKMNLNVFNKLIKIVDIDNRRLSKYYVHNPSQRMISFDDLGTDNLKEDFSNFVPSKEINHDSKIEAEKYELPLHYITKFKKSLNEFLENNKMKSPDCNMVLNRKIGEDYFFYLYVSIFQNYNKYLFNTEEETKKICKEIIESKNYDEIPIEHLCKTSAFLKEFKKGDEQFLNVFFQTKMFKDFMIRKYLNNKVDKFIFLHFDETILSKRNRSFFQRKKKTEFLECKILQATHCYGVDTTKNFSQDEYKFISAHDKNLINYYQRFNGTLFRYYLFPKLIYDNKYFEKLYMPPKFFDQFLYKQIKEYQKTIESLDQPKYFKIYDGDLSLRHLHDTKNDLAISEIYNDIILLWLRVFCLTFYYCEPKEKMVRFVEMLQNCKKAVYLKNEIMSLILITIKKYGDDAMTIKLFQNIKNFNYSQFAHMSNKLFAPNLLEPPQLKQLFIANSKLVINYFKDKEDVPKIFQLNIKKFNLRHRTFWGEGVANKSEKIKFENPICPICKNVISLKNLMKNLENLGKNRDINCLNCKKSVNLITKITLGDKISGEEKVEINIYNPYFLYNNISAQLIKIFGNKIDLTDLRNNYTDFFWNCILYFKLAGLSCDMLLKYNKLYKIKIEEEKKEESDNKKGKSKIEEKQKPKQDKEVKIKKFIDLKIVKINELK